MGLDHGPAKDATFDSLATSRRNARVGMVLFVFYFAIYAAFVAINAFAPDVMSDVQPAGVNLSVSYGIGLIALAFLLALVYAWICRNPVGEVSTRKGAV